MPAFTRAQVDQLLRPINPGRVLKDGKKNNHIPQQDVTAHLIRVFGFGGYDTDILNCECIFEHNRLTAEGKPSQRWDVGYKATVRLTIKDRDGREITHFEDGSTGVAQNQSIGDAHDLAMKSALSLAKKRCAVNLGDQFGLSLYNKGQTSALVIDTLVKPLDGTQTASDLQAGVPAQHADEDATSDDPVAKPDRVEAQATTRMGRAS